MKGQTSSFHLGLDYVTIDISIPDMAEEWVEKVEDQVNQYIYENRPIKHYLESRGVGKLPTQTAKGSGDIRVVETKWVDIALVETHLILLANRHPQDHPNPKIIRGTPGLF